MKYAVQLEFEYLVKYALPNKVYLHIFTWFIIITEYWYPVFNWLNTFPPNATNNNFHYI